MKRAILFFTFFLPSLAWGAAKEVWISTTGSDANNCSSKALACFSSTRAFSTFDQGGSTLTYAYGLYTSSAQRCAQINIQSNSLPVHTSNYIFIRGEGIGMSGVSTASVRFYDYGNFFQIHQSSYIWASDFYIELAASGIELRDSRKNKFQRIGMKNVTRFTDNFGAAVTLASDNNTNNNPTEQSSDDNLFEDIWITGIFKYGIATGGNHGYAEHNIYRRIVMRWDGAAPPSNPTAGIVDYGAIGNADPNQRVDGARNNYTQNALLLDFNPCSSPYNSGAGETCYGMKYNPHSATGIELWDSIFLSTITDSNWNGIIFGEDSASGNSMYNSVLWGMRGDGCMSASNSASSVTIKNSTIYCPGSSTGFFFAGGGVTKLNSLFWRTQTSPNTAVDNFNGYYPSTSNPSASSNELTSDPNIQFISSVNPTSAYFQGGLGGENVGATIRYLRGSTGTAYGETGWNTVTANRAWPWPYQEYIKEFFGKPDDPSSQSANSGNNPARGFALPGAETLSHYVCNQLNAGDCGPLYLEGEVNNSTGPTCNPCGGGATPASINFVQSRKQSGTGIFNTLAFTSDNTQGNFIAVGVVVNASLAAQAQIVSVSDSKGNTYSIAVSSKWGPTGEAGNNADAIYYAPNIAGGANTVTVTLGASGHQSTIFISEFSGVNRSSPLVAVSSQTGFSSTANSGNMVTSRSKNLILGLMQDTSSGQGSISAGSGYSMVEEEENGSTKVRGALESQGAGLDAPAATYNPDFGNTNVWWQGVGAIFYGDQTNLFPTASGITYSSFTVSYTSAGASTYQVAMSTDPNFLVTKSSGIIGTTTTGYINLEQNRRHYFQVKIATETDAGYTSTSAVTRSLCIDCNTNIAPTASGITNIAATVSGTNIGGSAQYTAVLASDSNYTSVLSSGTLSSPTTTYNGLSQSTAYYFEMKLATECATSYQTGNFTTLAGPAGTSPRSFKFFPGLRLYGVRGQ